MVEQTHDDLDTLILRLQQCIQMGHAGGIGQYHYLNRATARLLLKDYRRQHDLRTYQHSCTDWSDTCFGADITANIPERNYRFLEEALELVQACGCSKEQVLRVVDYVYNRPTGEPFQEVGGVMVTLAILCFANAIDLDEAAEEELRRVWTKVEQIRAKWEAKPKDVAI